MDKCKQYKNRKSKKNSEKDILEFRKMLKNMKDFDFCSSALSEYRECNEN